MRRVRKRAKRMKRNAKDTDRVNDERSLMIQNLLLMSTDMMVMTFFRCFIFYNLNSISVSWLHTHINIELMEIPLEANSASSEFHTGPDTWARGRSGHISPADTPSEMISSRSAGWRSLGSRFGGGVDVWGGA